MGDGSIKFGHDCWCEELRLKNSLPELHSRLARNKDASVVDLLYYSEYSYIWNISFLTGSRLTVTFGTSVLPVSSFMDLIIPALLKWNRVAKLL